LILDSGGHAVDVAIADVAGVDRTPELTLSLEHENGGLLNVVLLGTPQGIRLIVGRVHASRVELGDEDADT